MPPLPNSPDQVLRSLQSMRGPRPALRIEYVAPRDETEQLIAEIWGEVLHIDKVGRDDDLFSLGGDSLSMMQITSRIRRSLGMELTFGDFFANPTVGSLASLFNN